MQRRVALMVCGRYSACVSACVMPQMPPGREACPQASRVSLQHRSSSVDTSPLFGAHRLCKTALSRVFKSEVNECANLAWQNSAFKINRTDGIARQAIPFE